MNNKCIRNDNHHPRASTAIFLIFLMLFPLSLSPLNSHVTTPANRIKDLNALVNLFGLNGKIDGRVQLIVCYDDLNALTSMCRRLNVKVLDSSKSLRVALIEGDARSLYLLIRSHVVKCYSRNRIFKAITDPLFDYVSQSYLSKILNQSLPRFVSAEDLIEEGINGSGIVIAVIDTGIYDAHPDLRGKVKYEISLVNETYGFPENYNESERDYFGHGTHVAGIAAGTGYASNKKYMGVAPGAQIWNIKCLSRYGQGTLWALIKALEVVYEKAMNENKNVIVNLSLGAPTYERALAEVIRKLVNNGIIVVAAAGNEGPFYNSVSYPGGDPLVITVGAVDWNGRLTDFSSKGFSANWSAEPDVVAPGYLVIGPLARGSHLEGAFKKLNAKQLINEWYVALSGTSMATPVVSGACAIILQYLRDKLHVDLQRPEVKHLLPYLVRYALMVTARRNLPGYEFNGYGAGLINVSAACEFLEKNIGNILNSSGAYLEVCPNKLPQKPQIFMFPGDEYNLTLILITPQKFDTISVELVNSTLRQFFEVPATISNVSGVYAMTIRMKIPLNASAGKYHGYMIFKDTNGKPLDNVTISFVVKFPRAKALFDKLHNIDADDSPHHNFYKFAELFANNSIDVDVWQNLLTYDILRNYDILILTDVEIEFLTEEISAIREFVKNGGTLIVLGSFYPGFDADAVSEVLKEFGLSFTKENIELSRDLGILKSITGILTLEKLDRTHPITKNVDSQKVLWLTGVALAVDTTMGARPLGFIGNSCVLAVFESDGSGKIFAIGSERLFYDDLILEGDHLLLLNNTINWILSGIDNNKVVVCPEDVIIETGGSKSVNVTIGLYSTSSMNVTVKIDEEKKVVHVPGYVTIEVNTSEVAHIIQVYLNNSVGEGGFLTIPYVPSPNDFSVDIEVVDLKSLPEEEKLPLWSEFVQFPLNVCKGYQALQFRVNVTSNYVQAEIQNVHILMESVLTMSTLSKRNLTTKFVDLPMKNGIYTSENVIFSSEDFSDLYKSILVFNLTENHISYAIPLEKDIFVFNTIPKISKCQFAGEVVQQGSMYKLVWGASASFSISSEDLQDTKSELEQFAILIDLDILIVFELPLYAAKYPNPLRVPKDGKIEIPLLMGIYEERKISIELKGAYALILASRDVDGDTNYIVMLVEVVPREFIHMALMMVGIVAVALVAVFVIYRRKKLLARLPPRVPYYYPPTVPAPPVQYFNYCPYCGMRLAPGARYCPYCGRKLVTGEEERSGEDTSYHV